MAAHRRLKVIIEVTDDNSAMQAPDFETRLFALPGKHFGSAMDRNHVFHSIIGLNQNTPATKAWQPTDPVQTTMCTGSDVYGVGQDYQNLSITTRACASRSASTPASTRSSIRWRWA